MEDEVIISTDELHHPSHDDLTVVGDDGGWGQALLSSPQLISNYDGLLRGSILLWIYDVSRWNFLHVTVTQQQQKLWK